MKIEKQVCSLEQAKRLKELGVVQGVSYFIWNSYTTQSFLSDNTGRVLPEFKVQEPLRTSEYIGQYSAFTTTELGIMLPNIPSIKQDILTEFYQQYCNEEVISDDELAIFFRNLTNPNFLAELLIYLIDYYYTDFVHEVNQRLQEA